MPDKGQVLEVHKRKQDREDPPHASRRVDASPSGHYTAIIGLCYQSGDGSSHRRQADSA